MNPWVALVLVIAATLASDLLILWLYHRERQRPMARGTLAVITAWFFLSFGLMAFAVIPR